MELVHVSKRTEIPVIEDVLPLDPCVQTNPRIEQFPLICGFVNRREKTHYALQLGIFPLDSQVKWIHYGPVHLDVQ